MVRNFMNRNELKGAWNHEALNVGKTCGTKWDGKATWPWAGGERSGNGKIMPDTPLALKPDRLRSASDP